MSRDKRWRTRIGAGLLCTLSVLVLYLGFHHNQWQAAPQYLFPTFRETGDTMVMGRLVLSAQQGLLSAGGLPVHNPDLSRLEHLQAYLGKRDLPDLVVYKSQTGLQGILASLVDRYTPLRPGQIIVGLREVTALLSAATFAWIVLWFWHEFGLAASVAVLISIGVSRWLTLHGRHMWVVLWAFYVPVIAALYLLHKEEHTRQSSARTEAVNIFLAMLAKFLFNGYEYLTTTLLMMLVPYAYYGLRDRWPRSRALRRLAVLALASDAALLVSLVVLNVQVATATGDPLGGFKDVGVSLGKRSYGDPSAYGPGFAAGLSSSPVWVVEQYLSATAIDMRIPIRIGIPWLRRLLHITFQELIGWFAFASLVLYVLQRRPTSTATWNQRTRALIGATWFSILAPLSWFVLFKGHSYEHRNMNEVAWHMPFVLLGFALCGLAIQAAFARLRTCHEQRRPPASG